MDSSGEYGCTWPEQDAVEEWLERYFLKVEHNAKMELKDAVTVYRLKIQDELESLKSKNNKTEEKKVELSNDQKSAYRYAKWLYFMTESSKRSAEGIKQRNKVTPEYASEEAKGLYDGQIRAYENTLKSFIKEFNLPTIEEILNTRV